MSKPKGFVPPWSCLSITVPLCNRDKRASFPQRLRWTTTFYCGVVVICVPDSDRCHPLHRFSLFEVWPPRIHPEPVPLRTLHPLDGADWNLWGSSPTVPSVRLCCQHAAAGVGAWEQGSPDSWLLFMHLWFGEVGQGLVHKGPKAMGESGKSLFFERFMLLLSAHNAGARPELVCGCFCGEGRHEGLGTPPFFGLVFMQN